MHAQSFCSISRLKYDLNTSGWIKLLRPHVKPALRPVWVDQHPESCFTVGNENMLKFFIVSMTVFTSIPSSVTLECHSLAEYENLLSNVRKSSSDQRSRKLSAWILRHKLNGRASNERGRQLWEVSFPLRHQHLHRFSDSESYFHLNDIIFESVWEVRALQSNQHLPHLWCLCGFSSQSAGSRALSGSPSAWWQSETHQTDLPAAAHTHTHAEWWHGYKIHCDMPEAHKHTLFQFQSRQVPTQKIRQSNVNESDFLILNRVLKTLFFILI